MKIPNVTVQIIANAIKKLNKDKSDGSLGFNLNHLLYGGNKLKVFICLLFNSMIIHSYTPDLLLESTIISIPKNTKGDLSSSENYRGITLCNSLCKVLDQIVIYISGDALKSCNNQFAFKPKHSTHMATMVLKETISHYMSRGSNVYTCFVDASKAFDKINISKLFLILLGKDVSPYFLSLLYDIYTRQRVSAKWLNSRSFVFGTTNGVRQGAILSPILFNLYMDNLILMLKSNGIGCYIGCHYVGAICYADDLTLLCPTRSGLQQMLNICKSFGAEYNVTFNPKKTVCCMFSRSSLQPVRQLEFCDEYIEWSTSVKYLGNHILYNLKDELDVKTKRGDMLGTVNSLLANFGSNPSNVLNTLFKSYCCCFYGCQTWQLNGSSIKLMSVSFNKALRAIWRLPYRSHKNILYGISSLPSFEEILETRFVKLTNSMTTVENDCVKFIVQKSKSDSLGILGCNIKYLESSCKLQWKFVNNHCLINLPPKKSYNNTLSETVLHMCNHRDVRVKNDVALSNYEIQEMIDVLSTDMYEL
jgi:hypothetical protein